MFDPKDLLTFNKLITPTVIKIVYWIAIIFALISGAINIVHGINQDSAVMLIVGVVTLVAGPIYVRVMCEIILIAFKLLSELQAIRRTLAPTDKQPEGVSEQP